MINEPYSVMTATRIICDIQKEEHLKRMAKMSLEERAALVYEVLEMEPLKLTQEDYVAITRIANELP